MTADVRWAIAWMRDTAAKIAEHKAELTTLDREIGDGDHGENLNRGFTALLAKLDELPGEPATVGEVFKLAATTLMSTVGGASGPLYGTAFLRAAKAADTPELTPADVVAVIESALGGLVLRGKAAVGEKTMIDAWTPALEAAKAAEAAGSDAGEVLRAAADAAAQGALDTIPLKATKGRASYLGDRSMGHKDPGAASTALILESAAHTVN